MKRSEKKEKEELDEFDRQRNLMFTVIFASDDEIKEMRALVIESYETIDMEEIRKCYKVICLKLQEKIDKAERELFDPKNSDELWEMIGELGRKIAKQDQ